jgi:hypothetical protein
LQSGRARNDVRFRDDAGGVADLKFKRKHWWGGTIEGADAMYHCQKLEQDAALGIDGSRRPSFVVPYSFSVSDFGFVFLTKGSDGATHPSRRAADFNRYRLVRQPLSGLRFRCLALHSSAEAHRER